MTTTSLGALIFPVSIAVFVAAFAVAVVGMRRFAPRSVRDRRATVFAVALLCGFVADVLLAAAVALLRGVGAS